MEAPMDAQRTRLIKAMQQAEIKELQGKVDFFSASTSGKQQQSTRLKTARELEQCQQRLEEVTASRAALSAEVQVRAFPRHLLLALQRPCGLDTTTPHGRFLFTLPHATLFLLLPPPPLRHGTT